MSSLRDMRHHHDSRDLESSSSVLSQQHSNSPIHVGLDYEKEEAAVVDDTMSLLGGTDKKMSPLRSKSPFGKRIDQSPMGSVASAGTRRKLFESCRQVMMKAKSRGRGQLLIDDDDPPRRSKSRHRRDNKEKERSSKSSSKSSSRKSVEDDVRSTSRHSSRHDEKDEKERRRSTKSSRQKKEKNDSSRQHKQEEEGGAEYRSSKSSRRVSDESLPRSTSRHRREGTKKDYSSSKSSRQISGDKPRDRSPSRRSKSRHGKEEGMDYSRSSSRSSNRRSEDERYRKDRSPSRRDRSPSRKTQCGHQREGEKKYKSSKSSRHVSERDRKDHSPSRRSRSQHRKGENNNHSRSSRSSRHFAELEHRYQSPSRSSRSSHKQTEEFTLSPSRSGRHLAVNEGQSDSPKLSQNQEAKEISLTPDKSERHLANDQLKDASHSKTKSSQHHVESEHSSSTKSKSRRRISVDSDDNTCSTSTISSKSSSSKKVRVTQQEYLELKESIQKSRRASQKDILARLKTKQRLSKGQKEEKDRDRDHHHHRDQEPEYEREKGREHRRREREMVRHGDKKSDKENVGRKAPTNVKLDDFMPNRQTEANDTLFPSNMELEPGFEIVVHPEPVEKSNVNISDRQESVAEVKAFWEAESNHSPSSKPNNGKVSMEPDPFASPKNRGLTISPRGSASPSKLKIPDALSPRKAQSCKTLMEASSKRARASVLPGSKMSPRKEQSARTLQSKPLSPRSRQKKRHNTYGMMGLSLLDENHAISEEEEIVAPTSPRATNRKSEPAQIPEARPGLSRKSSWRVPSVGSVNSEKSKSKDTSPRRPTRPSLQRTTSWRPPTDLNDLDKELEMKRSNSGSLQAKSSSAAGSRRQLVRTSSWRPPSVREGPSRRKSENVEPRERVLEKPRAVYTEEDIFTSYTWSLTRQDFYKVQKERLLLKDSIRDTAFFRAYDKIVAAC